MRLSLSLTSWPTAAKTLGTRVAEIATAADEGGVDTLWVADHLLQADPRSSPTPRCSRPTRRWASSPPPPGASRLGTLVTGVTPAARRCSSRSVTTLDVLSGGRAWLGLGAGYAQDEARAMVLPLPPTAERFERLEETLRIATQMWAGDTTAFHGRHYRLEQPIGSRPRSPAASPDPRRRGGRAQDAAARRPVRRRLQPLRHPGRWRDDPPQARRPRPPLRAGGSRPRHARQDAQQPAAPGETAGAFADRVPAWPGSASITSCWSTAGPWSDADLDTVCEAARLLAAA